MDIIYIGLIVVFFLVTGLFVALCKSLTGGTLK